jgi:hypothetical protein
VSLDLQVLLRFFLSFLDKRSLLCPSQGQNVCQAAFGGNGRFMSTTTHIPEESHFFAAMATAKREARKRFIRSPCDARSAQGVVPVSTKDDVLVRLEVAVLAA